MAWEYPPSFPGSGFFLKVCWGGKGAAAVGIDVEVFMVYFLDKVLQRLVELLIKDVIIVGKTGFNKRFVEQNLDARVCLGRPPMFWRLLNGPRKLLGYFPTFFYVKVK